MHGHEIGGQLRLLQWRQAQFGGVPSDVRRLALLHGGRDALLATHLLLEAFDVFDQIRRHGRTLRPAQRRGRLRIGRLLGIQLTLKFLFQPGIRFCLKRRLLAREPLRVGTGDAGHKRRRVRPPRTARRCLRLRGFGRRRRRIGAGRGDHRHRIRRRLAGIRCREARRGCRHRHRGHRGLGIGLHGYGYGHGRGRPQHRVERDDHRHCRQADGEQAPMSGRHRLLVLAEHPAGVQRRDAPELALLLRLLQRLQDIAHGSVGSVLADSDASDIRTSLGTPGRSTALCN